jgi:D-alanyl-D-alanine carboxypeptidase/D-alanyl-D-alanine-endopeptidase (penicillin-binding protein 4)
MRFPWHRAIGCCSLLLGSAFWLQSVPARAQEPPKICPTQLNQQIEAITNRPEFRHSRWGILVQTLGRNPETLYAQDEQRYFIPASNVKLLTTAAALTQLGPQFRIRTAVYQLSNQANGVALEVLGHGDPSLTDRELKELAQQIQSRGITQVSQLIGNDHYFQGDAVNPSWEWEDVQAGDGAPVNSLILNQNLIGLTLYPQNLGQPLRVVWDQAAVASQWQIENSSTTVEAGAPEFLEVGRDLSQTILHLQGQLRVGSAPEPVAIANLQPAQTFIQRFQQVLAAEQIHVDQTLIAAAPDPQQEAIAAVESPSLAELLTTTNQASNNLYAEALLRLLGITQFPRASSSLEAGINALKAILTALNIDPESYRLVDGSGLSRRNLVSPTALVQVLQAMAQSPQSSIYRASLSVAGASGTLQNRFRNTPVAGNLQGKTGTLTGVVALSGYLNPPHYSALTFSILVNQFNQPVEEVQQAVDEVVESLVQLQAC